METAMGVSTAEPSAAKGGSEPPIHPPIPIATLGLLIPKRRVMLGVPRPKAERWQGTEDWAWPDAEPLPEKNMDQYKEKIQNLKNILTTNDEFKETFKYFFDNLGENQKFVESGKIVKNKIVKGTLDSVSRQIFGVAATITHLRLLKAGKESFLHGSCFLNGKLTAILYFEDINMGMLGISMSPATGQMSYVRFSSTVIEGDKIAFFMGSESKTVQ